MTSVDPAMTAPKGDESTTGSPFLDRLEETLEKLGERLNPILVKEARQALKSKQFLVTFSLLLGCGWGWSLLGIALLSPGVHYTPGGPFMLVGYYFVLAVPLLIIVPFSAFRSLASEREDGTYELLSITALTSRQIVTGKLGSAILQMLVFYSALSPCIAFTYLLRGIDIITILLILAYSFLASLILSVFGLMVATITRARHWQVFLSVVLLAGLLFMGIWWSYFMVFLIIQTPPYEMKEFWTANLCIISFYVSFFVLFIYAAAGQISFASENRATKLRAVMIVQQTLWIGWMMYYWISEGQDEILFVMLSFAGIYWAVVGSLMCGETAELSPRAMRELPQSFLGRMNFTWFNPGSGTGYMFAVTNLFVVVFVAISAGLTAQQFGFAGKPRDMDWIWFGVMIQAYVTAYLGVGRLLHLLVRKFFYAGLVVSFLIQILLVTAGAALPYFFQLWLFEFQQTDFTQLQFTNWFWTLIESVDGDIFNTPAVPGLVIGGAALIFLINMLLSIREVAKVRLETPQRVKEDEAELHPERVEETRRPRSPWDEDDE